MVSVQSDPENNFISYQMNPKHQRFWIGGRKKVNYSTEWTWTDGRSFEYENFCAGKPSHYEQKCLDIGFCSRDTWDDQDCDDQLPFICKKTIVGEQDTNQGIVNGTWGQWGSWSRCSCGKKTRYRDCDNLGPQHKGINCDGSPSQTVDCSGVECRGRKLFYKLDCRIINVATYLVIK